jgi:hypothetical protein
MHTSAYYRWFSGSAPPLKNFLWQGGQTGAPNDRLTQSGIEANLKIG